MRSPVRAVGNRFGDSARRLRGRVGGLSDSALRRSALGCALTAVACAVGAVLLHHDLGSRAPVDSMFVGDVVLGSVWPLAGVAVLWHQPRNRCGWLLVGTGVISVYLLLGQYSVWDKKVAPLPLAGFTDWISMFGFVVYFFVLPLLPLIFPDGHFASRLDRILGRTVIALATAATVARLLVPERADVDAAVRNPIQIDALYGLNYVTLICSFLCLGVATPLAVVAVIRRTRRAVGVQRAQLQWFMVGGIVLAGGMLVAILFGESDLGSTAFVIALLAPPLAVVAAVLRYRLRDAEFALSRSIVLVVVVGVVAAGGGLLLWQIDPELAGTRAGVALVVVCVLGAFAVRAGLQRLIDDWWFPQLRGSRTLAPKISAAVSLSSEPRAALTDLILALQTELRLPYVAFEGVVRVGGGVRPERVIVIEAVALGRRVGQLEVAPRRPGEDFTGDERQLLEQCAAHAAMMAYAAALVTETENSRARIVAAREEERRRLRNDLHDGVGPALAGIALQMDALAVSMRKSGDEADARTAKEIRDRVRDAVVQVRAVSHGLRPPVLDQLGLALALRQLVDGLGVIDGSVQCDDVADLPAAAEVATYAIAAEAVTNVVRHSAASRVRIDVERGDLLLELRVSDNGRGMPVRPTPGVGLTSMRQRAAEVGGRLEHLGAAGGGTVVRLILPVDPVPAHGEAVKL